MPIDETGNAAGEPIDLLAHIPPNAKWSDGFRPVDVDFDECGRLLLSSDGTREMDFGGSKIVRIESIAEQCEAPSSVPSSNPTVTSPEPSTAPVSDSSDVPSSNPTAPVSNSSDALSSSPTFEATSNAARRRVTVCIGVILLMGLASFV